MSIQGSSDTESFGLYVRNVLAPRLRSGQIVRPYGQPIRAHKAGWVRDLIEQKGCQLWLLPSYSPDLNPIEEAFSKVKNLIRKAKARTLEALAGSAICGHRSGAGGGQRGGRPWLLR